MTISATIRPCSECLFQNYWQAGDLLVSSGTCLHPRRANFSCEDERAPWKPAEQAFPSLRQRCGPAGTHWVPRPRFFTIVTADRKSK